MAHLVVFPPKWDFILSQEEIRDLINLFYRWDDTSFIIVLETENRKHLGEHSCGWDGAHKIAFSKRVIEKEFALKHRVGGNFPAPSLKTAAAMVLAHELQHANQEKFHKGEKGFYGHMDGSVNAKGKERMKRYWGRACEREARQFVDEHLNEICAYFAEPCPMGQRKKGSVVGKDEVQSVADVLSECEEVTFDDIREELRSSKVLTPGNFKFVTEELKKRGFSQMMDVLSKTSVIG